MFWKKQKETKQKNFQISNNIPAGTFLITEKGLFFVRKEDRLVFITKRVFDSWSPPIVIHASEEDAAVKKLKVTGKMKFRDGSLINSQSTGKMYLVSSGTIRHIQNPDWIKILGKTREDAVWASSNEINLHKGGEPLV